MSTLLLPRPTTRPLSLDIHVGEWKQWLFTASDRVTGSPVPLADGTTIELVLISCATNARVLALSTGAGIEHADQTTSPGQATVTLGPLTADELPLGDYRVLTWVVDAFGPQVADDKSRLTMRSAQRAALATETRTPEEILRSDVLNHFYGPSRTFGLPVSVDVFPDAVVANYTPAYPYNTYAIMSSNLLRIDQIRYRVDGDVTVYAYHYVNRSASKWLAVCHEGHSYFDLPNQAYHIQRLLNLGWNVVLVQMPTKFTVESPPAAPDPSGAIDHGTWCLPREATDPGYLRTFFAPALAIKRWLRTNLGYAHFIVVGISGGGYSATFLGAMDPDFKYTACVAGTGQFALFAPTTAYDYEQIAAPFHGLAPRPVFAFLPNDYVDLYAMAADGGRTMRIIHIENEISAYFPSTGKHSQIDAYVAAAEARVSGQVVVGYDTSQSTHEISQWSGDLIVSDLATAGLIVTGPTGATIVEPTFAALIAWYRGDAMTAAQLTDKSGNGNHLVQASAPSRGTLVLVDTWIKQPCMQFTAGASNQFYACAAAKVGGSNPPAYAEYSIFGVYRTPTPAAANYMLFDATDNSGNTRTGPFAFQSAAAGGTLFGGINTDVTYVTNANQEWQWFVVVHTAAARSIYVGGVLRSTTTSADSSAGVTELGMGLSLDASPFYPLTGYIAEMAFTGHALTPGEIAALATYVNARYGL